MKGTAVLIDTSIWIEYFRGKDRVLGEVVSHLIDTQRARLCGVVLAELLSGTPRSPDRDELEENLDALQYLEVSRSTWVLLGQMTQEMRRRGTRIPFTDMVISALAIENGAEVYTTDSHFQSVPGLHLFESQGP